MALILHIDTAVQSASVCLAEGSNVLALMANPSERDSAAWLHVAIQQLLQQERRDVKDLQAIAVSAGPGSYTGLRVGMATAKGLCYALSIPLISINTLQMMAAAVDNPATSLLCPMIDARRMEVFTAIYDTSLQEMMPPTNLILQQDSFNEWLETTTISFFGNGSTKAAELIHHPNARFIYSTATAANMAVLASAKFEADQYSDLAYVEPFYGKDFHSFFSKRND